MYYITTVFTKSHIVALGFIIAYSSTFLYGQLDALLEGLPVIFERRAHVFAIGFAGESMFQPGKVGIDLFFKKFSHSLVH
jgi:hypothetical protein